MVQVSPVNYNLPYLCFVCSMSIGDGPQLPRALAISADQQAQWRWNNLLGHPS